MAIRELQTAAAHVLHVERPTDLDLDQVKDRLGLHPLDVEAVFSVPVESTFSAYGDYAFLTLLWPEHDSECSEIRFFVSQRELLIIGDTTKQALRQFVHAITVTTNPEHQHTPAELLHDLLERLLVQTSDLHGLIPARRLASVALTVRQLGRWLHDHDFESAVPFFVVTAHRVDVTADRVRHTPAPTIRESANEHPPLPRVVRSYAVASALMVVVVIVTLSLL